MHLVRGVSESYGGEQLKLLFSGLAQLWQTVTEVEKNNVSGKLSSFFLLTNQVVGKNNL